MCIFHKWEIQGIEHVHVEDVIYRSGKDVTVVLFRCKKCGKLKTVDVLGSWTLEQIKHKEG